MTELDRQIQLFIAKAILNAGGEAVGSGFIKHAVRSGFSHLAFTDADLNRHIVALENHHVLSGTTDTLLGSVWSLTPAGRIRAQQL